jgi:hypothetical protein
MFGFTLNVIICDYKYEKIKIFKIYLQTIEDIYDSNISILQQNTSSIYPKILTDNDNKLEVYFKENVKFGKLYFTRDDEIFHKQKKLESFYNYLFSNLYLEIENNIVVHEHLKYNKKYFKKKDTTIRSQFSINLNINIKNAI